MRSDLFGQKQIDLGLVSALEFAPQTARKESRNLGVLYRKKGEPIPGKVLGLTQGKLKIDSAVGELDLPREGLVGLSDAERNNPPAVGSTIKFRYQELTDGGVPRFPSYVGIRTDAPVAAPPAKKEKPPAPTKAPATISSARRRFQFVEGSSDKFWEIETSGSEVTVRYGRTGSNGQTNTALKGLAEAQKGIAERAKDLKNQLQEAQKGLNPEQKSRVEKATDVLNDKKLDGNLSAAAFNQGVILIERQEAYFFASMPTGL